jgi:hypothetical protein
MSDTETAGDTDVMSEGETGRVAIKESTPRGSENEYFPCSS